MKKLINVSIFITTTLSLMVCSTSVVFAANLQVGIDVAKDEMLDKNVTVSYQVTTDKPSDDIAVKLWQNDKLVRTEFAKSDQNYSGHFKLSVPKDGVYLYYYTVSSGSDTARSDVEKVNIDSGAPGNPSFQGVSRVGDSYTIRLVAPADSDVRIIRIYGSDSKQFSADDSTFIGQLKTSPNQPMIYTYTAPDSRPRFFALQAYDEAGNGSDVTGTPGIVVARSLRSEALDTTNQGVVEASGKSNTDTNTNAADLLSYGNGSPSAKIQNSASWSAWLIVGILVLSSLIYLNRSSFSRMYLVRGRKK